MKRIQIAQAIDRGLDRLDQLVSAEGVWLCHLSRLDDLSQSRIEENAFVSALGSFSLRQISDARAAAIDRRSLSYVLRTMLPKGLWRYWDELPPDSDITSLCQAALGPHPQLVFFASWCKPTLLQHRSAEGLFHVWLYNGEFNDTDAVVNANVTAYLGDIEETRAAHDWLCRIVCEGKEREEIHYYWDSIDLFSAMARAHLRYPTLYAEILPVIVERIQGCRKADGSYGDGLRTAMAVSTLHQLGAPLSSDQADTTARHLLSLQQENGGWPASPHFSGPGWPRPRMFLVTSPALEIACCLEALTHLSEQLSE